MLTKLVEKKVRDKRRGKTYTSKMLTLPKSLVKMWGDVDFVMLEIDKRGRLIVTPVPAAVAREYAEGERRVEV
jgi:hypothetical protein